MAHPLYKHDYSPGQKFNRLTIVSREGMYAYCDCECGKTNVRVQARSLGSGNTKSCGCWLKGETNSNYRHGERIDNKKNRLYSIWVDIKKRAGKEKYYEHVKVCKQWQTYPPFKEWALANGYADSLQIDRIKNHLGYSPKNCRWVTPEKQSQNRRKLFSHNTSGYPGVSKVGSKSRPWRAYYCKDNKAIGIGNFKTPLDAHRARLKHLRNLQHV